VVPAPKGFKSHGEPHVLVCERESSSNSICVGDDKDKKQYAANDEETTIDRGAEGR
jgi:hypothetical protein